MTREFSITEVPSITYKLRNLPEGGWADITLREWPEGGSFQCQSDYGDYAHIWTSIGDRTFKEFLCGLDKDYFLKKTRSQDYLVFDSERTCKQLREEIIRMRREGDITKEVARQCWEDVESVDSNFGDNVRDFCHGLEHTHIPEVLYDWDYCSIPILNSYHPSCTAFWERVWPHIVAYWREHP